MSLIWLLLQFAITLNTQAKTVDAKDYTAFWLWGDIRTAPYLNKAKEIYVLQGEFRPSPIQSNQPANTVPKIGHSTFQQQGVSILKIPHQKVWLVFRNHHLDWTQQELKHILKRVHQWENAGNHVVGIQIDYDSKTKNLKEYALFLEKVRKQLPQKYKLSITGLMDWSNHREPSTLYLLRSTIDELIIQTYQGTTTIPNYQHYLQKIQALKLPYKIGLVQHGHWNNKINLNVDPNFKGYVVFLLKDRVVQAK